MQSTIKLIILVKQCFDMSKKLNSTESVELVLPKYDEEALLPRVGMTSWRNSR